ncbi:MAG TPA: anaerobic sulfatase maturase [Ignavibacteria bacterium]|nr:anaerobic sulfatase maturase [Ignavibacteria bacterium]HMR40731.1 anaerobic sulfatase maturase [Ignavibacteria bacterium]
MNNITPQYFHVLAKPTGAICNLDCKYCFFLSKEMLYPGSRFRMADELLEEYIKQLIESQEINEVSISWQGGEPTLMGLDFFKRSIELANKYRKPGMNILYTMQTNGILIDDEWCRFLKENNFLMGLSIDGTKELHDFYRVDKGGHGTFDKVVKAANLMDLYKVDFNLLTTVHAHNQDFPLEIYRYFRDEMKAKFIQFIPIVERDNDTGYQEGNEVTDRTVDSEKWGDFLIKIFDEWVRHDVGEVYVQMFDSALASWYGLEPAMCIFNEKCGKALALEHNGDLYSCDHFVEPKYLLGNIMENSMPELVSSEKQIKFGSDKLDTLPEYCLNCEVRFACHGECPKNRFILTPDGKPGLNYLCAGYKKFFNHIDFAMKYMVEKLKADQAPSDIVKYYAETEK